MLLSCGGSPPLRSIQNNTLQEYDFMTSTNKQNIQVRTKFRNMLGLSNTPLGLNIKCTSSHVLSNIKRVLGRKFSHNKNYFRGPTRGVNPKKIEFQDFRIIRCGYYKACVSRCLKQCKRNKFNINTSLLVY